MTDVATVGTHSAEPKEHDLPDIDSVKVAHLQLMRAYLGALEGASRMPWNATEPNSPLGGSSMATGFFVRLLVGTHIRRKTLELVNVYLQLEQVSTAGDPGSSDRWLRETGKGCLEMAAGLPKMRLPGILILIPVITALLAIPTAIGGWFVWAFLGATVGLALVFVAGLIVRDSYRRKREFFLPDATHLDKEPVDRQRKMAQHNVYALEDELFATLRRGKRREIELDRVLPSVTLLLAINVAVIASLAIGSGYAGAIAALGSFLVGMGAIGLYAWRWNDRAWR